MSIWPTRPVAEQGTLTLVNWRILEVPSGGWHLVGYCWENYEGRVSSLVLNIEEISMRATTISGRVYLLMGAPAHNSDAMYVWSQWRVINSIESWTDVTDSVWNGHLVANRLSH